ncbi:asparagine synthase (glutamine-hydrolysing) [Gammaproteobacteria bacterium]
MCGIVGEVTTGRPPHREALIQATTALRHRGPDGEGSACFSTACLGHRRLSVLDPAGSPQPWHEGSRCLVYNGEVYNYLELRQTLEAAGETFVSHGDTEVLMRLYARQGVDCLTRLNGMYAFAVWDDADRSLFLARDRLGKKPLYYALLDDGLVFASEPAALLAFPGVDRALDPIAVNHFFAYQFVPGVRTIYRGIRRLPPGHWLRWQEGRLQMARYWSPPLPEVTVLDESILAEELVALVDDAVRLRLRSDVPIGAFLSGGLDSAVVVSALVRLGADLDTYTVGFGDDSFDERRAAAASARHFGTRHHARALPLDLPATLAACVATFGEPFADPSAIPTWHLCRSAREQVTVALSGDGGDELFGGYRRYAAARWADYFLRLPQPLRQMIARAVAVLPEGTGYYGHSRIKQARLFLHLVQRLEESPGDWLPQTFSLSERLALLAEPIPVTPGEPPEACDLSSLTLAERMMQVDLHEYLAEDILTKVDRMAMAHGLEVRAPLLDYRVVEFAQRLPLSFKIRGGVQKYLLRHAFRSRLPMAVLRGAKHGFAVPVGTALRGDLAPLFQERVLETTLPAWLRREEVLRLWREHGGGGVDHGFKLWSILVFMLWHNGN